MFYVRSATTREKKLQLVENLGRDTPKKNKKTRKGKEKQTRTNTENSADGSASTFVH